MSRCHVELKYECETDEALSVHDLKTGGSLVFSDYGSGMRDVRCKKTVVSDGDGVIEEPGSPSMAKMFVEEISGLPSMRGDREYIHRDFVMMDRGDQPDLHAIDLQTIFRKNGLRWRQYDEACYKAARGLKLVPGYNSGVEQIRDMAYDLFYLSASPERAFYHAQDRLMVDMGHVKASEFFFDEEGRFESMEINLGGARSDKRDDILRSSCMSDRGFDIMIDDNPVTGGRIAKQGWNHACFWVGGEQPMMRNVSVMAKDIRQDYRGLPARLRMMDRAMMVMLLKDEFNYGILVGLAQEVPEYAGRCISSTGLEFGHLKDAFADRLGRYMEGMKPVFPSKKSGLSAMLEELRLERNEERAKRKIGKMAEIFESMSPERKMSPLLY